MRRLEQSEDFEVPWATLTKHHNVTAHSKFLLHPRVSDTSMALWIHPIVLVALHATESTCSLYDLHTVSK
jgi:hypothetical protein